MKIVQITTDNRVPQGLQHVALPHFGSAPAALIEGFADIPGVELHVVSCTPRVMTSPEKLAENIWFHQPHVPKIGWGRTLFLGCARAVRNLMKEIQPDIVHGQGTERDCAMAAVLSGYPNVLTIHGNMRVHASRQETRSLYYSVAACLESFALSRTDGVVAISRYTEDLVKNSVPCTWLLPNAAELRYFGISPEPTFIPRILFIGTVNERKNPLGLIKACEPMLRAGKCTLAIAGPSGTGDPYAEEVQRLANEIPGIEMLGSIAREELPPHYRTASVLVLPTFEDNCPMVVLEAMAAGVPVAASRVGGVPDLIEHEVDGLLFDPYNPSDMRSCIERLIQDSSLRSAIAARGHTKARTHFHPRVIAEKHLEIYKCLLKKS